LNLFFTGIGSAVAILIGKELFGGLGYNIFNPALVGRAFLQGAFPVQMTTWHNPEYVVDSLTQASPLALFKFADATQKAGFDFTSYLDDMLIGNIQGSLGETSGLAIIIAGVFLIAMGIVNWRIPVSMILGVIIFAGILHLIDPARVACPGYHLLAGGFLFGAVFMATDWVTSPLTSKGMWIFGLSLAFLIVAIRSYGGLPEGVMYAILIMNGAVPLINRYTRPEIFGVKK
jgi:electron transport complex protein RnfD